MKKLILFIAIILTSTAGKSQEIGLSQIVDVSFLKNVPKLTPKEISDFKQPSASIHPKRLFIVKKTGKGDFYDFNGIFMKLNAGITDPVDRRLENYQIALKHMASLGGVLPPNYSSEIRKIKDLEALVIYKDESRKVGSYAFFCSDSTRTKFFNGIMEFNKSQKDKATAILDEMLKSVTFK